VVKNWHDDFSMIPPLKPPWEALSISGNMTINNFHNLDDDSLATLDNIVIMSIKTTIYYLLPHYDTRQGASFDVEVRRTSSASLDSWQRMQLIIDLDRPSFIM
jgi:hypothetical protein